METLFKISRILDRIVTTVGKLAGWLAIPMILIILLDVTYRRFGGQGSVKLQEMEWHLHGALFLLCFGYAYLSDSHVRIELLRDQFGPKTRAWVEIFGILIFLLPYCVIMIWYAIPWAFQSFTRGEISSALTGLPHRWIIKAVLPLGILITLMAGITVLLRTIVFLFGPPELRAYTQFHVTGHHADMTEVDTHEIDDARGEK